MGEPERDEVPVLFDGDYRLRSVMAEAIAESSHLYCHPQDRVKIAREVADALQAAGYGIHRMGKIESAGVAALRRRRPGGTE